jgi:pantoate kinase
MAYSDDDLIRMVLDSEDFQRASSINEVKNVVRRLLRKPLIDMYIGESSDVTVRETLVNRHIEWITLRILKEVDGILLIPEYYDDLESFRHARHQAQSV